MDVLRKELNDIYKSQQLHLESLDPKIIDEYRDIVAACAAVDNDCRVITDASADLCWVFSGAFGKLIGLKESFSEVCSSDEDEIYNRMHPVDLVDKRMLEYEFFKFVDALPVEDKMKHKATCRIRIKNRDGNYLAVTNSTQILRLSTSGKIWLILCRYDLAPNQSMSHDISPRIVNFINGEITEVKISEKRAHILTDREKEILRLIRDGKPSKQIADMLEISIHTVNRHRQNILEKLSVGNSHEAIMAAFEMELM